MNVHVDEEKIDLKINKTMLTIGAVILSLVLSFAGGLASRVWDKEESNIEKAVQKIDAMNDKLTNVLLNQSNTTIIISNLQETVKDNKERIHELEKKVTILEAREKSH